MIGFDARLWDSAENCPFPVQLSAREAAELRRRTAKYTLPYFQVQRAKIILMAAKGLENSEIAARLDSRRDVVSEWHRRFLLERLAGLGRNLVTTQEYVGVFQGFRSLTVTAPIGVARASKRCFEYVNVGELLKRCT